jgi:starch synthase
MHIVHIASELAPLAKVGGLADVVYGLSKELIQKGHLVDIIIPKYDCMDDSVIKNLKIVNADLKTYYEGKYESSTVWQGKVENLNVFFIEPHNESAFFSRGTFYDCFDNIDRFTFFSRAALEFLLHSKFKPDVVHCHDWHTALIPVLYHEIFKTFGLTIGGFVFTIHNLEHQALCQPFVVDKIGLNSSYLLHFSKLQDPQKHDHLNLLKGGIVYSTYFTTVSPNYAKEIQTSLGGFGLQNVINHYHYKFLGILNGLDWSYWDPSSDPYLTFKYRVDNNLEKNKEDKLLFKGKADNKKHLRHRLRMSSKSCPIVSCISRLVRQKGVELIEHALFRTLELGGQFILLGTSPDPKISEHFHSLKVNLGHNPNVHFEMQYNEELSHQIFAGSDFFIVPSLFEPCGLTQLISLRYGTIPIVRKTGGLADTVFDVDYSYKPQDKCNGYTFDHPDNQGLESALDRAIHQWYNDKDKIKKLIKRGMSADFSWKIPATQYLELYRRCAL